MHKGIRWTSLALVSLALAGAGAASAQSKAQNKADNKKGQTSTTTTSGQACPTDDKSKLAAVLTFLHGSHQNEIKHAKMAVDRARSPEVKSFADRMVREHTDADKKLTDLAGKKGIDLTPMQPIDPVHAALMTSDQRMEQALSTKKGAAFDAAFMGPEMMEHTLVLAVIEEGQKVAKDDEVKRLLDDQHQAVTQHKEHASTILEKMKPATGPAIGGGPNEPGMPGMGSGTMTPGNKKGTPNKGTPKNDAGTKSAPDKTNPDWINPDQPSQDLK